MFMATEYYIYINGFWGGFDDKTDANNIGFFEKIFKKSKICNYEITSDLDKANVLFESVFGQTFVNLKKWIVTIHFSGEPFSNHFENYNIVLYSEKNWRNVVDMPLFAYYIHGNNFLDKLLNKPLISKIPGNFCCFIVSNGGCRIRNKMFEMLNGYKPVHSYGKFANNMGGNLLCDYWTEEYRRFLSNYKFIICFENSKFGTYCTEKIVNPYLSGTIPIYWSSHHVKNIFNQESMIFLEDETDASFRKVFNKIVELDNSDEKYLEFANKMPMTSDGIEYWNDNYTIDRIANNINKLL